jgi:hypothetical protein
VRRTDEAACDRQRRADELVDAERIQQADRTADVHQGVDRPELVEVHVLGVDSVHAGLRLGEARGRRERSSAHVGGQPGGLQQIPDRPPVAVARVTGCGEGDVQRSGPVPFDTLEDDLDRIDAELEGDGV